MNLSRSILLTLLTALIGCTTIQEDVKQDRTKVTASCERQVNVSAAKFKEHAMSYMGVSKEQLPGTLCNRLADGVANGLINQSDINQLIATGQLTAKFRFLKG